jgi:hypothetical protein
MMSGLFYACYGIQKAIKVCIQTEYKFDCQSMTIISINIDLIGKYKASRERYVVGGRLLDILTLDTRHDPASA